MRALLDKLCYSITFVAVFMLIPIAAFVAMAVAGAPALIMIFAMLAVILASTRAAGFVACLPMLRAMRRAGWPPIVPGKQFTELFSSFPQSTWRCLPPYDEACVIPGIGWASRRYPGRHLTVPTDDIIRLWSVLSLLHDVRSQRRRGLLDRVAHRLLELR